MLHPSTFYQEFKPSATLAPYIKCYGVIEYNEGNHIKLTDRFIPLGCPHMSIRYRGWFDNSYKGWFGKYNQLFKKQEFSDNHISGQILNSFEHCYSGDTGMIAIVFQPSGFYHLFKLNMHVFTQNAIDIHSVLGPEGKQLISIVEMTGSPQRRVAILESFFEQKLRSIKVKPDDTDHAIHMIRQNPTRQIDEVCRYLKVTSRHLRRRFKEKIGIGPKYYLRICRFHHAIQLSHYYSCVDLLDLTYRCGYYDQSHFSNDIKQFTDKTPLVYFKKNNRNLEVGGIHS